MTARPLMSDVSATVCREEGVVTLRDLVRDFRRRVLAEALARADGNRSAAARALGVRRTYFMRLLREAGLQDYARGRGGWPARETGAR